MHMQNRTVLLCYRYRKCVLVSDMSIFTVLPFQDVFCGYDEDKVYTYIFYRDTVIGEMIFLSLLPSFWT